MCYINIRKGDTRCTGKTNRLNPKGRTGQRLPIPEKLIDIKESSLRAYVQGTKENASEWKPVERKTKSNPKKERLITDVR